MTAAILHALAAVLWLLALFVAMLLGRHLGTWKELDGFFAIVACICAVAAFVLQVIA
jgi:hypothetical protein